MREIDYKTKQTKKEKEKVKNKQTKQKRNKEKKQKKRKEKKKDTKAGWMKGVGTSTYFGREVAICNKYKLFEAYE